MFRIGHRLARSIHRKFADEGSVDVSESDGVRYLHLGNDTIQSAMRPLAGGFFMSFTISTGCAEPLT